MSSHTKHTGTPAQYWKWLGMFIRFILFLTSRLLIPLSSFLIKKPDINKTIAKQKMTSPVNPIMKCIFEFEVIAIFKIKRSVLGRSWPKYDNLAGVTWRNNSIFYFWRDLSGSHQNVIWRQIICMEMSFHSRLGGAYFRAGCRNLVGQPIDRSPLRCNKSSSQSTRVTNGNFWFTYVFFSQAQF